MLLPQKIDENIASKSFWAATNNSTYPLGHRTARGTPTNDSASIFSHSTNSTASNLIGTGRVLGNFYSLTGRHLERTLGDIAHRVGFGPEAIYQKICEVEHPSYRDSGWCRGELILITKVALSLTAHCQTLHWWDCALSLYNTLSAFLGQVLCSSSPSMLLITCSSVVDSTRFKAIMLWRDLLLHHPELYIFILTSTRHELTQNLADNLLHIIEAFRLFNHSLSHFEDEVLTKTSLLINCHSVGLSFLLVEAGFGWSWIQRATMLSGTIHLISMVKKLRKEASSFKVSCDPCRT